MGRRRPKGEACVAFEISVLETDSVFTAANLTELFQPFLMEADDTDYTSDPNGLFGRVIHGYDPAIGMNSLCIQYLYYWSEVWEGDSGGWSDGELIHYDDFELVQVYLNLTYKGGPVAYRFVFDNRDYYTNSDTEWRDSMEYSIYEWDVSNTAIITEEVENSEDLKPLLGETYTAHYQYKNLTQYTGDFCSCYGGVASLILTVETYNHQFAMGDTADHSSGSGYLGQYYIDPYTDDVIYDCYSQLNYSFTEGVHLINGYTVP